LKKLIDGGQIIIDSVDAGPSYKILRTRYAPHLLHASETNCEEPNVEHEPELERPQFSDLVAVCKEILAGMGNILESMTAKAVTDPEPPVLVETEVVEEP